MRRLLPPLFLVTSLAAQEAPRLELDVLYAGKPDHERTAQWREFLTPRVKSFSVVDVEKLTKEGVGDADVVVVDCPDPIVRNADGRAESIRVPRPAGFGVDFGHPTIVVGGMAMLTDDLELKSNWL